MLPGTWSSHVVEILCILFLLRMYSLVTTLGIHSLWEACPHTVLHFWCHLLFLGDHCPSPVVQGPHHAEFSHQRVVGSEVEDWAVRVAFLYMVTLIVPSSFLIVLVYWKARAEYTKQCTPNSSTQTWIKTRAVQTVCDTVHFSSERLYAFLYQMISNWVNQGLLVIYHISYHSVKKSVLVS